MPATANQERDELAFDLERRRGQPAFGRIALQERIHQALAQKTADGLL